MYKNTPYTYHQCLEIIMTGGFTRQEAEQLCEDCTAEELKIELDILAGGKDE